MIHHDLQRDKFGIMLEMGAGYMFDVAERICIRIEGRFSPISLSGTTNYVANYIPSLCLQFNCDIYMTVGANSLHIHDRMLIIKCDVNIAIIGKR